MVRKVHVTGRERYFGDDDLIVSKTNLQGKLTYTNKMFLDISDYKEAEVLGQPHSIIRHPDMPRSIFKLLWDTIKGGDEIFAYVINRAKNGDHYWVLAHVTPSKNAQGEIIGYHSNRRVPDRTILSEVIMPLYKSLLGIEQANSDRKLGLERSFAELQSVISSKEMKYDEFIASLSR